MRDDEMSITRMKKMNHQWMWTTSEPNPSIAKTRKEQYRRVATNLAGSRHFFESSGVTRHYPLIINPTESRCHRFLSTAPKGYFEYTGNNDTMQAIRPLK